MLELVASCDMYEVPTVLGPTLYKLKGNLTRWARVCVRTARHLLR